MFIPSAEKHKSLWLHPFAFALKLKMLIFEDFLPLKMPLVTTFSKTRSLTSKIYAADNTKSYRKQLKLYKLLWLRFSVSTLEF